jgi:CRISPR-associated endonuclease/helicase Cas3
VTEQKGSKRFFAHSRENQPTEYWQTLDDHLKKVAELASRFASAFDSSDWAWNAAMLHDIGKLDDSFQAYLMRCNGLDDSDYDASGPEKVNHSSAGAALAEEYFKPPIGRIMAYLAAGHHAGLPDYIVTSNKPKAPLAELRARLSEGKANLGRIEGKYQKVFSELRELDKPPSFVKSSNLHIWMRMIFSSLVDADFLDTEAFMNPDKSSIREEGFLSINDLKCRFDEYMKKKQINADQTPVNKVRKQIFLGCIDAAKGPEGLYALTVPTGGGKTLSGLAFALEHAITHNKRRIIYVIPYTSIIEQTAKEFREIFGEPQVVEHHSNIQTEHETPRAALATENWDAPIVVTTNVQFFESLYACKPSRCRKLHNLVNSVVVLDEAQMIPPAWLVPCVEAINHLTALFGVTLLMTTATQPALPGIIQPKEIITDKAGLYRELVRTQIIMPKDFSKRGDWDELAERLAKHKQVLCIVNTRRDCYELFKRMPEGTIHLSALLCGEHRSAVIREIKQSLKDGKPIRVISTQLVEAGVDIDFPVVFRAMAGLDSIAQAAGRCNREGKLNKEGKLGQVKVFLPPKPAPLGLLRKGEDTCRMLASLKDFDPQNPQEYTRYFEQFYAKLNDDGSTWLKKNLHPDMHFSMNLRTAGQEFKLIEDQGQQAVLVRYGGSSGHLEQLRKSGPTRELLRRLQRYTVNLSQRDFLNAQAYGVVEEVYPGFWAWNGQYSEVFGLDLFGTGWAVETLIQ